MEYLIGKLLGASLENFRANKLKVITFNFDRSFERRLFLAVTNAFKIEDKAAGPICADTVPVLHIHGQLGAPDWMPQHPLNSRAYTRAYAPPTPSRSASVGDTSDVLAETAKACSEDIKIVHEEIPSKRVDLARAWIKAAGNVWFIGFGYDRLNLERLGFDGVLTPASAGVRRKGTVYGHPKGDLGRIHKACPGFIPHPGGDALQFMLDEEDIHD